jgi:hypothetical protein
MAAAAPCAKAARVFLLSYWASVGPSTALPPKFLSLSRAAVSAHHSIGCYICITEALVLGASRNGASRFVTLEDLLHFQKLALLFALINLAR